MISSLKKIVLILAGMIAFCLLLPRLGAQSRPAAAATAPAAVLLSKEQLLQRVTELRLRIKDISVVTTDVVVKGPPDIVQQSRRTIVLKRDMMYIDELYGMGPKSNTFHVQLSFDGRQTIQWATASGDAMISKGRSHQMD